MPLHRQLGGAPRAAVYFPEVLQSTSHVVCMPRLQGSPEIYGAATPTKQLHHDYKAKAAAQCGVCASVRVGGWECVCVCVRA